MIEGRWFITPRARDDYRRVMERAMDDDQVLIELAPLTLRAHRVKEYPDGKELWRGRALNNHRLRLIVAPPKPPHTLPALVAVLPSHNSNRVPSAPGSAPAPPR